MIGSNTCHLHRTLLNPKFLSSIGKCCGLLVFTLKLHADTEPFDINEVGQLSTTATELHRSPNEMCLIVHGPKQSRRTLTECQIKETACNMFTRTLTLRRSSN